MKEKQDLRQQMKGVISKLSEEELAQKSKALEARFIESPEFNAAESLMVYVAVKGEPETLGIIKAALKLKKQVFVPKVEGEYVCVCRLQNAGLLKPGKFGIPEPPGETKCELREFDLVVIPGLAFDLHGNRLGRGGGFYDRLLSSLKGEFVAFAFDEQVVKNVPNLMHDVKVHKIFTDKKVVECLM